MGWVSGKCINKNTVHVFFDLCAPQWPEQTLNFVQCITFLTVADELWINSSNFGHFHKLLLHVLHWGEWKINCITLTVYNKMIQSASTSCNLYKILPIILAYATLCQHLTYLSHQQVPYLFWWNYKYIEQETCANQHISSSKYHIIEELEEQGRHLYWSIRSYRALGILNRKRLTQQVHDVQEEKRRGTGRDRGEKEVYLYCMWMKRRESSHNHGIATPAWNNQVWSWIEDSNISMQACAHTHTHKICVQQWW